MSTLINVRALREKLGIKRLRKSISISDFEKAVINGLRKREKHRIMQRTRLHA